MKTVKVKPKNSKKKKTKPTMGTNHPSDQKHHTKIVIETIYRIQRQTSKSNNNTLIKKKKITDIFFLKSITSLTMTEIKRRTH